MFKKWFLKNWKVLLIVVIILAGLFLLFKEQILQSAFERSVKTVGSVGGGTP